MKKSVTVGFSGGKDSTTSVILLKEKGYDVSALTMKLGLNGEDEKLEKIKKLAELLDVPHYVTDLSDEFKERIIDYFINAYSSGLTPNPCAMCNIRIKFDLLMNYGLENIGSDLFATGHYAATTEIEGKYFLKEPSDRLKSQIYFLSMIGGNRLKKVIFPIAEISVGNVRDRVKTLPLGNKKESQDVCFLNGLKLNDYLRVHIPEMFRKGKILDVEGNEIGEHDGSVHFTIGQRRGTGFSSSGKLYVIKKDARKNTITLGDEKYLFSKEMELNDCVFWRRIRNGEKLKIRIRYLSELQNVVITEVGDDKIKVVFDNPVKSVTSGQVGAVYEGDIIVASGIIK